MVLVVYLWFFVVHGGYICQTKVQLTHLPENYAEACFIFYSDGLGDIETHR